MELNIMGFMYSYCAYADKWGNVDLLLIFNIKVCSWSLSILHCLLHFEDIAHT